MATTAETITKRQLTAYLKERVSTDADAPHQGLPFITEAGVLRVKPSDWIAWLEEHDIDAPKRDALRALKDAGARAEGLHPTQTPGPPGRQELRALHRPGTGRDLAPPTPREVALGRTPTSPSGPPLCGPLRSAGAGGDQPTSGAYGETSKRAPRGSWGHDTPQRWAGSVGSQSRVQRIWNVRSHLFCSSSSGRSSDSA
jgi:hypothetical protein